MGVNDTAKPSNGYYPAPFPEELPTIQLKTFSVADVYDREENIASALFDVLCNEGFFYVDLNNDPRGQKLLDASLQLHDAAKDVFNNIPVTRKEEWKGDPLNGVLDTGYRAMGKDESGEPRVSEVLNIPAYQVIHDPSFQLPEWLEKYREAYRTYATSGHEIGQAIFRCLETNLHLPPGELTKMHALSPQTGGFVRMFRLPAPSRTSDLPPTPAHTDGNSMTILSNWQGGLQIARPIETSNGREVKMIDDHDRPQDEWLFVKPKPGHVIVNLGDPMVVLTNGLLASGRHRVVTPPGEQGRHHRYSVLVGLRPKSDTPMRPLRSDVIAPETGAQKAKGTVNALEYAVNKVRAIMERTDKSGSR